MSSGNTNGALDNTNGALDEFITLMKVHNDLMLEQLKQIKKQNDLINTLNNNIKDDNDYYTLSSCIHNIANALDSIKYDMNNNSNNSNHCCCRRSG